MTQSTSRKASGIAVRELPTDEMSAMRSPPHGWGSLRQQIAITRTLLDELEDSVPSSRLPEKPSVQIVEELIRLGCGVLDAAAVLAQRQEAELEEQAKRLVGTEAEGGASGAPTVVNRTDAEFYLRNKR